MDEKKLFLSTKIYHWSELELNDLFSRIHIPLNKIGKSIGFCLVYEKVDDALDDNNDFDDLIEINTLQSKNSSV